jgi:hypothetical protein
MPFTPAIYINRPEPMEAVQVTADNEADVADWCGGKIRDNGGIILNLVDGRRRPVLHGGWIVRNPRNGYWAAYSDADFTDRYDPAA